MENQHSISAEIDTQSKFTPVTAEQILAQYEKADEFDKDTHLYAYAIVRGDLQMPPGKLSAQAGHAYDRVLDQASLDDPERHYGYRNDNTGGSKVTLKAKNQNQLIRAYNEARAAGLPAVVIVDRGHVFPPHFDGNPIITAVGIGPCTQAESRPITKRFNCV